jgi:DNA-binding MarR family transcriptional regulator
VVAIQKEMFRDHFFFDKMEKVELQPLRPMQMVEAYRKRFNSVDPFTEDALLSLARMSRGIFRRFLRYITLTLRDQDRTHGEGPIDVTFVKQAIPVARLAEDMELELTELFPKHSDLRMLAVRLIMFLQEHGERKQSELAGLLDVEPYVLSRLLTKLETARYVSRRREGNDKIVSLYSQKTARDAATNQVVLA